MKYSYMQITNKRQIGKKRPLSAVKFIVIHYTGNYSKGADALAHYRYLQRATRYGSAHYFVDDRQIIQVIGDSLVAWSVGDNQGYGRYLNGCTNYNSISIEMCVNKDADLVQTYKNVLELTKNLMVKFNVPASNVVRHYDVSRKDCPHNFRANNWALWWQFKTQINEPIEYKMDLSKSSEFGAKAPDKPKTHEVEVEDVENLKEQDQKRQEYIESVKEPSPWAVEYIDKAKELGIVKGYIDGEVLPRKPITREEAITMIVRALEVKADGKCSCTNNGGPGYSTGL